MAATRRPGEASWLDALYTMQYPLRRRCPLSYSLSCSLTVVLWSELGLTVATGQLDPPQIMQRTAGEPPASRTDGWGNVQENLDADGAGEPIKWQLSDRASTEGQGCACESSSGWKMMDNMFFTGPGKAYVTTTEASAEQCRLACCYRKLGCEYFSFDGRSGTPQTCTLWVSIEQNTLTPSRGYTSGKLLSPHCTPPAGVDPMHPRKLFAAL